MGGLIKMYREHNRSGQPVSMITANQVEIDTTGEGEVPDIYISNSYVPRRGNWKELMTPIHIPPEVVSIFVEMQGKTSYSFRR